MSEFNFDDLDFSLDLGLNDEAPKTVEPTPEPKELTDDDVDDLFADITANLESEQIVVEAMASVMEAEYILAQAEAANAALKAEEKALAEQRAAIEKQLAEIARRQQEVRTQLWDKRVDERRKETRVTEAKHAVEQAKQNVIARRRQAQRATSYERAAKGKAWWEGLANGHKILDHQWVGAQFLASAERAILGDGMGLGKTITAIAALDLVNSKRALVVAPADVNSNFVAEVQKWAPHRPVISIKGMTKVERNITLKGLNMLESFVVVVNYEAWRKDFALLQRFVDLHFDVVILDEAHTIKETSSEGFKGCHEIILTDNICPRDGKALTLHAGNIRRCPECSWSGQHFYMTDESGVKELSDAEKYWVTKSVKYLWTMTGTPILNAPHDIYAMLALIDPRNFYNKNSFLREYCLHDPYTGRWTFRPGGVESLTRRLSGRYLARTLKDTGIVLPEQKPILHELVMDPERYPNQARVIAELAKFAQFVLDSGRAITPMAAIALITRQRQANVWPGGITIEIKDDDGNVVETFKVAEEIQESIKIDRSIELIQEFVDEGKRVVLFSQFSSALAEIHARLNGSTTENGNVVRSVRFDGSTPDSVKEEVKTNFNKALGEEAKWDVVLCNYKTGGVGLNLTAAEHTIILDEEWNPGKRDQAYGRTRRIGQDQETFIHLLRIPKTVDTWLANLIEQKEDMISGFDYGTQGIQEALRKAIQDGEVSG